MTESSQPRNTQPAILLILTAVIFLLVGLLLSVLITSDRDNTVSRQDVADMVSQAVGTQVAALDPQATNAGSSLSQDDVQAMINQAVGTQVAALRPTATPIPPTPTRVPNADAAGDDAFRGPADAPVVMVEFSDYQCPYCLRFYEETLPQILQKYPNQVKFVYRDFVIFGEDSVRAAMATRCAGEQDKFWEMQAAIFDSRKASDAPPLSQETLVGYAETLGLDTAAFTECLTSGRYSDDVTNDYQAAVNYGFTGTPGFLINGRVVNGAQPFQVFDQVIQEELAAAQQ